MSIISTLGLVFAGVWMLLVISFPFTGTLGVSLVGGIIIPGCWGTCMGVGGWFRWKLGG